MRENILRFITTSFIVSLSPSFVIYTTYLFNATKRERERERNIEIVSMSSLKFKYMRKEINYRKYINNFLFTSLDCLRVVDRGTYVYSFQFMNTYIRFLFFFFVVVLPSMAICYSRHRHFPNDENSNRK